MAETKIGGRDIKDSNVEAIDLNFASAEAMILSATATGFVVWDRTASKAKEVRLSVLETYFNTKYPLTTDSRINNGQTAFDWGNHAGKYVDLLTNQASIGGNKTFNNKIFLLDTLSLGTSASGERLHIADGNIFRWGWRNCVQNKKVNNIYQYSCKLSFYKSYISNRAYHSRRRRSASI
jgi:hypothetical protein